MLVKVCLTLACLEQFACNVEGNEGAMDALLKSKLSLLIYTLFHQPAICSLLIPLHHQCYWSNTLDGPDRSNCHLR